MVIKNDEITCCICGLVFNINEVTNAYIVIDIEDYEVEYKNIKCPQCGAKKDEN
jgi:hypothetical protein